MTSRRACTNWPPARSRVDLEVGSDEIRQRLTLSAGETNIALILSWFAAQDDAPD
jgi:hypothetical protein